MSRMAPRQSEIKAYSSLDNNSKKPKNRSRARHETLTQVHQDNSSLERSRYKKTNQPVVRNINLDDDDANEGSDTINERHIEHQQREREMLMEKDKI